MRRFLFGAGCYLAGIMTLPMLSVGVHTLSARSVSHEMRTPPYRGIVAQQNSAAQCQVMLPAAGNCHAAAATVVLSDVVAQADFEAEDEVPFGQPAPTQDEPESERFVVPELTLNPPIVRGGNFPLPIGPEALSTGADPDEAEAAKIKDVRETLKKVVDEKIELLSLIGLQAELHSHQSHLAELKSLKELLALKQSLQELRDKFPDSDAGRRAAELLNLLEQQHHRALAPTPIIPYGPRPTSPAPTYEDTLRSRNRRDSFDSTSDAPIKAKGP